MGELRPRTRPGAVVGYFVVIAGAIALLAWTHDHASRPTLYPEAPFVCGLAILGAAYGLVRVPRVGLFWTERDARYVGYFRTVSWQWSEVTQIGFAVGTPTLSTRTRGRLLKMEAFSDTRAPASENPAYRVLADHRPPSATELPSGRLPGPGRILVVGVAIILPTQCVTIGQKALRSWIATGACDPVDAGIGWAGVLMTVGLVAWSRGWRTRRDRQRPGP